MENLKLFSYLYSKDLGQFKRLGADITPLHMKEVLIIIEHLEANLIQFEVDEKLNILFRKSVNKTNTINLTNQSIS